jgi:hypothetical protein
MAIRNPKPSTADNDETVPEVMSNRELGKASGQEVEKVRIFNSEQLGAIDSFDAAMALATAQFGDVLLAHEQPLLGDGFKVATEADKHRLCGVALLFLDWTFQPSDYGQDRDWVFIHAVQRGDDGKAVKWIISDGGTGIAVDLQEFTAKTGRVGGLAVKNGLSYSKYYIDDDTKEALSKAEVRQYMTSGKGAKLVEAGTFYLDTSA